MGLKWSASQNLGIKALLSKVPVDWLDQTSKTADPLIIPDVSTNNLSVPHLTGGNNNWKFDINHLGLGLIIGCIFYKVLQSITPVVLHTLEIGGDSDFQDKKNPCK